jgi:hypothetical protein
MSEKKRDYEYLKKLPNGEEIQDNNQRLLSAAPDFLERDIKFLRSLERMRQSVIEDQEENGEDYSMVIDAIDQIRETFDFSPDKKATGKDYREIKKLLGSLG